MSTSISISPATPTKDPLAALGPSIFLTILSSLPFNTILKIEQVCHDWQQVIREHEKSVWRDTCNRTGLENKEIQKLLEQERSILSHSGTSAASDGDMAEGTMESGMPESQCVDWRNTCRKYVTLDRNWRFGRCRNGWITTPENAAWRLKIDEEQGTCLTTARTGGLRVVDAKTSQPLFTIAGVRAYAHLEFVKGFAIFDVGSVTELPLQVYRTSQAISRSANPKPLSKLPVLARTSISHTDFWTPEHHDTNTPIPRGHLMYYRSIVPPTPCRAFRARLDREGTGEERAMLGVAGQEAIYIYDLDDPNRMETIKTSNTEGDLRYIEFDDDYVFICRSEMWIYSRKTGKQIMRFPGNGMLMATYITDMSKEDPFARATPSEYHPPGTALTSSCPAVEISDLGMNEEEEFIGCHYTETDLICITSGKDLLILRNYKNVFALESDQERLAAFGRQALVLRLIDVHDILNQVTTYRHFVVISTDNTIFWFDTRQLPKISAQTNRVDEEEQLRFDIIVVNNIYRFGIRESSCLQMDKNKIYAIYSTSEERDAVRLGMAISGHDGRHFTEILPPETHRGMGLCVRVWDFTP